jgi:hypothetical protein
VTRPRKMDRRKGKSTRNVFLCYVCGAAGSGKTSLLRSFAGKPFMESFESTTKPISVVNSVDIDGSEKYLVVSLEHISLESRFDNYNSCSCRNLVLHMSPRRCGIQKRLILPT